MAYLHYCSVANIAATVTAEAIIDIEERYILPVYADCFNFSKLARSLRKERSYFESSPVGFQESH